MDTAMPLCLRRRHQRDGAGCDVLTPVSGCYKFNGLPPPWPLLPLPPNRNDGTTVVVAASCSVLVWKISSNGRNGCAGDDSRFGHVILPAVPQRTTPSFGLSEKDRKHWMKSMRSFSMIPSVHFG